MCNTYEYEYGFVCVYTPKHKHIYDSLTHMNIILAYNMRHLNFFFGPWHCCWAENYSDEILSHQDFNLWLTFAPSNMIKPRLCNPSPNESFQTLESFWQTWQNFCWITAMENSLHDWSNVGCLQALWFIDL